jgi:Flp pilus assembly protein TadD
VYDDPARRHFPNRNIVYSYEQAHLDMARALLSDGKIEEAKAQIRLALRINPKNKEAKKTLAGLESGTKTG